MKVWLVTYYEVGGEKQLDKLHKDERMAVARALDLTFRQHYLVSIKEFVVE